MTRLQKFVEEGRAAYVFHSASLPQPSNGMIWKQVNQFNAAEELLNDPSLGAVLKTAIEKGCAVVTPKAKTP
jgi:hypothetical protein